MKVKLVNTNNAKSIAVTRGHHGETPKGKQVSKEPTQRLRQASAHMSVARMKYLPGGSRSRPSCKACGAWERDEGVVASVPRP